jgi:hypothetical protein
VVPNWELPAPEPDKKKGNHINISSVSALGMDFPASKPLCPAPYKQQVHL